MTEAPLFRYRVTFGKRGRLSLLSHLELTHALERMIRRSGLPFAVTQGFSPHMRIGFGAALPVGVGSTCEVFDLYLVRSVAPAKILAALAEASPEDLRPTQVVCVAGKKPAASIAFPLSTYEAILDGAQMPPNERLSVPETVTVERNGTEKTFTVADYLAGAVTARVFEGAVGGADGEARNGAAADPAGGADEGIADRAAGNTLAVTFTLRVLQTGSLRPDALLSSVLAENGIEGEVRTLTRIEQRAR